MIDVIPVAAGVWLARCECGATERFPDAEQGWEWVLGHPCPDGDASTAAGEAAPVIDLTSPDCCRKS